MENETVALCALNRIFGSKPIVARQLVERLGSAMAVFGLDEDGKLEILGPFNRFSPLITQSQLDSSAEELERLSANGGSFIGMGRKGYPPLLEMCEDAPVGLYVRSSDPLEALGADRPYIAVVGTRDISPYGREWCRRVVGAMAAASLKPVIVSGLAIGTDITAHAAALECGLPTIGVLPTGIDAVYPRCHYGIASRIASAPGSALITDYPPLTAPLQINFLRRNRIIAGICGATILIESKRKGGGMMTARLAFGYERDVFALPGRVDDLRSQGCNQLIREKIADPVEDLGVFVTALGLGPSSRRKRNSLAEEIAALYSDRFPPRTVGSLTDIALLVRSRRGITPEEVSEATGLEFGDASGMLTLLESDGILTSDLLRRYSIVVKIT